MPRGVARIGVVAALVLAVAAAAPAGTRRAAQTYTGGGFDTCSAPQLSTMQAWLSSPYRSLGVYLGGVNRACPDGNLSLAWASNVVAAGWTLMPLYVGLQAPCVTQPGLALINPSAASSQGAAAADDAASRAATFGFVKGTPVYFDMEGYSTKNPSCTQAVQAFLSSWTSRLRADGYLAGVYGSAASTIRDLMPLADSGSGPDAVWIADWNGKPSVLGDPYVPDSYWPSHQRVHQYSGGHKESYAGVTVNIDSDAVDGPVVGPGDVAGTAPPPVPQPQSGSVTSSDGAATVTWPANAFTAPVTVTATPSALVGPLNGFAAGGYALQLAARTSTGATVSRFSAPLTVTFHTPPGGTVPASSTDGKTWHALPLIAGALPAGTTAGYALGSDGSVIVSTLAGGWLGLLQDIAPPTEPSALTGRFVRGRLLLAWHGATDNSGSIASYAITLNGTPLASAAGNTTSAAVRSFYPHQQSVFRVAASDAAGNTSSPSGPVVVRPTPRPKTLPKQIPTWAFQLAAWQLSGKAGRRPAAPKKLPAWYWRWQAWRKTPFELVRRH